MAQAPKSRQSGPRLTPEERARLVEELDGDSPVPQPPKVRPLPPGTRPPAKPRAKAPSPPAELAAATEAETAPEAPRALPSPASASHDIANDDPWLRLSEAKVDRRALERNLIITGARIDPAHTGFDVLRTRMVQTLADQRWRRVAVVSPTTGCGSSFTALNLAVSLSRYHAISTFLLDMDLRTPTLARYMGLSRGKQAVDDVLQGRVPAGDWLARFGENRLQIGNRLAFGVNHRSNAYAAELFQSPDTAAAIDEMLAQYLPEVVLYDLPPVLAHDDAIAFRDNFDCVLMVVGSGITRAAEVREAQRRLGEDKPLLGVILNKAEGDAFSA